jgi:hypothetical protein
MNYLIYLLLYLFIHVGHGHPSSVNYSVASGHLPVVIADDQGAMHLVYGRDSTIFYATANGPEFHFGAPVAVATLPDLVAGAKRGPQVAISGQNVVITAVNRVGDLFAYSMNRTTRKWSPAVRINDVQAVAKEGFQSVSGASDGTFHSVWLDLRDDKRNKIVGATSHDGGHSWSPNRVIYHSPDGTVCECCRVTVKARNNDVYIQFRNWLGGSRDLYLAHSTDGGLTYAPAQKLGAGTWKVNACPMDGGAVVVPETGKPLTVWRRENTLYTCVPGEPEQAVATGRNITLAGETTAPVLAWDENGTVWMKVGSGLPAVLGKGQMPSLAVAGKTVVCAWESDGQVMAATKPLASK